MIPFTLLYDSNLLFRNVPFPFLLGVLFWVWGYFFFLLCNCHEVLVFIDFLSYYFLSFVSFSNSLLLPAVTKAP